MKISTKLTAGFLLVSFLVFAAGYYSAESVGNMLEKKIGDSTVMLAQNIIGNVDREIYNRYEEAQTYSKDVLLQQAVAGSNEEFSKFADVRRFIDRKDREWRPEKAE
ncbi:MAG: hypothetical protein OEU95_08960, partial [Nitrospirota bacterium]|nr:hypothetical protein [Nitrospirota bacterium]